MVELTSAWWYVVCSMMRILTERTLREFWQRHPDAELPLRAWIKAVKRADWRSPSDIRAIYSSASIVPGNRMVFNIKGNTYRLVVGIDYHYQTVYIRFIGTHADYDRINAAEV